MLAIKFQIRHSKFQIILFILILTFNSCSKQSQITNPKFQIKDDAGVEISFDSYPKRIISLAPNITEALFAIGADSMLIGVTNLCDYPPEAKTKTKTGNYISPDYEVMASLKPDLIIMNVENVSNPTYQALKNLGMKIYVSNAKDIDGILKMLNDFGKITGKETKAAEVSGRISSERLNYIDSNSNSKKEKSFIVVSVNPLMTASENTFINEVVELSGFDNIYKSQKVDYPLISYEDITQKNPVYIILPADTSNIQNIEKYSDELSVKLNTTDAIKKRNIIVVDENVLFRPGPRVLEGVKMLRKKTNNFYH